MKKHIFLIVYSALASTIFVTNAPAESAPADAACEASALCRAAITGWGASIIAPTPHGVFTANVTPKVDAPYGLQGIFPTDPATKAINEILSNIEGAKDSWKGEWRNTKNIIDDDIYKEDDRRRTFYCGCDYTSHKDSNGSGDISKGCKVKFTTEYDRGERGTWVEWEHVVPKSYFDSKTEKYSIAWIEMATDLHNIVPSIGAVNGKRHDKRYGVAGRPPKAKHFEGCPEVYYTKKVFEPSDDIKPIAARISMYMYEKYELEISQEQIDLFKRWCLLAAPGKWEKERNERIHNIQGDRNYFVVGKDGEAYDVKDSKEKCNSFMKRDANKVTIGTSTPQSVIKEDAGETQSE